MYYSRVKMVWLEGQVGRVFKVQKVSLTLFFLNLESKAPWVHKG